MVDPPVSVTLGEVLDGIVGLVHSATAEPDARTGLQRLVEAVVQSTGALGAGFAELARPVGKSPDSDATGRVVAASGSCSWLLGRPVTLSSEVLARMMAEASAQEIAITDLGSHAGQLFIGQDPSMQLAAGEPYRMVLAHCVARDAILGFLMLCYPIHGPVVTRVQRSVTMLYAAFIATLYQRDQGLLAVDATVAGRPSQPYSWDDGSLFIAVTSHELRTPVTVIRGYADTLMEHWDNLEELARRSAIAAISQRARDLGRLLDRLLVAAGDDAAPAGTPFDVSSAVREAIGELSSDLRRSLRFELPANLPKALGDRTSISMILTELVTNACKYSPPDRVEVEVTTAADQAGVLVRVADRGIGISAEHSERAFERFWQLDPGGHYRGAGVGLGLYLVRRIVERQHGWVSLRPRPGGGTVVEVRLPRVGIAPGEA